MRSRSLASTLIAVLLAGCSGQSTSADPASPEVSSSPATAPTIPAATTDVLSYRGGAARSGAMPGPGPTGSPTVRWTFQAGGPIGSQPLIVGNLVYVLSSEGTLYALDVATGEEQWRASVGGQAPGAPEIADGLVILGAGDGAHAFSIADGKQAWTAPQTGVNHGAPAIVGHVAVFDSTDSTATAVDTRTGAVLWTHDLEARDETSVAAADGLVILGLQNGIAVALSITDGTQRWRTDTGDGTRIGTPAIADGRVYLATLDSNGPGTHHIIALDLATGQVLWKFASPGDVPAYTPAIADGRVITEGEDGSVTALDPATGALLWQVKAPGLVEIVPSIAGGAIYGATNNGSAYALDAATGATLWTAPIRGVPYGEAIARGLVLVGTSVGTLYAIGAAQ